MQHERWEHLSGRRKMCTTWEKWRDVMWEAGGAGPGDSKICCGLQRKRKPGRGTGVPPWQQLFIVR